MPFIHFEYTQNLDIQKDITPFLRAVHDTLVEIIKTDLSTCRSTMTCHENFVIADGSDEHAFIQLSVRMLPGRDKTTKQKLGDALIKQLRDYFKGAIASHATQTRVLLTEVDRDFYFGLD